MKIYKSSRSIEAYHTTPVNSSSYLFTQCLSAGSDGQIKLWSLGQQRCIITFPDVHAEGIWTLQVNKVFISILVRPYV